MGDPITKEKLLKLISTTLGSTTKKAQDAQENLKPVYNFATDSIYEVPANHTLSENEIWSSVSDFAHKDIPRPLTLKTYYPVVSEYPFTGHSTLYGSVNNFAPWYNPDFPTISIVVNKQMDADDYNFVTNNCADATGEVLAAGVGKSNVGAWPFTTPGDVQDFARENYHTVDKGYKDGVRTLKIFPTIPQYEAMQRKQNELKAKW